MLFSFAEFLCFFRNSQSIDDWRRETEMQRNVPILHVHRCCFFWPLYSVICIL